MINEYENNRNHNNERLIPEHFGLKIHVILAVG